MRTDVVSYSPARHCKWRALLWAGVTLVPMMSQALPLVTSTADAGPGSLRQVIAEVGGGSVILEPSLSGQTITLTSGPIIIDKSIVISATNLQGGLTISGSNTSRIFHVVTDGSLELGNLTLRDGRAPDGANGSAGNNAGTFTAPTAGGVGATGGNGGAILNEGQLVMRGCTLTANRAGNGGNGGAGGNSGGTSVSGAPGGAGGAGGQAGAVFSSGSLQVTNCTFSGNFAGNGGNGGPGGSNATSGRATGGNGGTGGGGGALAGPGAIPLNTATVAFNTAGAGGAPGLGGGTAGPPGRGGGILAGALMTLSNTLVAENTVVDAGTGRDLFGSVGTSGYNFVSRQDGSSGWSTTDVLGTNAAPNHALLGPLTTNGGNTLTHALPANSPAVNAANPSLGGLDQRGLPRNSGGRSDIGAYEYQYPPLIEITRPHDGAISNGGSVQLARVNPGGSSSITFTIGNSGIGTLSIAATSLSGPDAAEFTITPPGSTSLTTSQTTTLRVDFIPTSVGSKAATLHIISNDPQQSPFDINLSAIANGAPTDLLLSYNGVMENSPPGTLIGTLEVIDPNPGDSHTLTLVSVTPFPLLALVDNQLLTTTTTDYESLTGVIATISAVDGGGLSVTKEFPIRVIDVDEPPQVSAIPDIVLADGTTVEPIPFTVIDIQQPNLLTVTSPAWIAGDYAMSAAIFGPPFPPEGLPVEFAVAQPIRGNGDSLAALDNAAQCVGKAVLMERGTFAFDTKVANAQNSGAIATVIYQSFLGSVPLGMSGMIPTTIPSGMVSRADGLSILIASHHSPVTGVIRPLQLSLEVSVASDNPQLLPSENIALAGADDSRSLTLTPAPGISGSATVTVTATDNAGNITTRDFRFTVPAALVDLRDPDGSSLAGDESALDFGNLVVGETTTRTVTIRNTGGLPMNLAAVSIEGAAAASYAVFTDDLPASLVPGAEAVFPITFKPLSGGVMDAIVRVVTDASNTPDFALAVTGRGFSPDDDTDGDGLNDAAEWRLAALGFDWAVAQPEKVAAYFAAANLAGLYRKDQLQALQIGTPLIERSPQGEVTLRMKLKTSADLQQFAPFDFTAGQLVPVPAEGAIDLRFIPTDDAAFFRVEAD